MARLRRSSIACALALAFVAIPVDGGATFVANASAAAVPVAAVPVVVVPVRAASAKDRKAAVDKQLRALRENLEGTSSDLVEAVVALRRAKLRLSDARAELATARRELAI